MISSNVSKGTHQNHSLASVIEVDSKKCVNCHQCISVCPSKYCNDGSGDYIKINPDLCVGCGACIEVCEHEARFGVDDFDQFMQAVSRNERMVAVVAPAIASNYPDTFLNFNGWLKSLGIQAVFDVSFGAELTVKSYLEAIKAKNLKHVIAQPCPALVGYVELHQPELIRYLAPADSPMAHTLRMIREYYPQYKTSKLVIISPCYAKRREFDEIGLGDYNVTIKSLDKYFKEVKVELRKYPAVSYDNPEAERAVLFSSPGGLLRTAQRELPGIENLTRKIEGRHTIYPYFNTLMDSINKKKAPLLIDCLNCEMGCNGGPGTLNGELPFDEVEASVEKRNLTAQQKYLKSSGPLAKRRALKKLHKYIDAHWKPGLYDRRYVDHSALVKKEVRIPTQKEIDEINRRMYKLQEKDLLNCCSCGYGSCDQMAIAIYNNLNKPENCRHYQEIAIVELNKENQQKSVEYRQKIVLDIQNSFQEAIDSLISISAATEEMSTTVNEVAKNSEQARSSSSEMGGQAISVSTLMHQLGAAAKEISIIIKSINDISSQTNLLALNATIEAASAGDAGKGFAVVANEVKELAKKTSVASDDIKVKIEAIQSSVDYTIANVDTITQLIKSSEEVISSIATSITEQATVTQDISVSISRILANVKDGMDRVSKIAEVEEIS